MLEEGTAWGSYYRTLSQRKRKELWPYIKGEGEAGQGEPLFTPASLYSMVQLTLAPWVNSAVKGKVLGGRSGSKMLMIWGCGFLWQNSMFRGSGMGALSLTSNRTRRSVPVPVAMGEP